MRYSKLTLNNTRDIKSEMILLNKINADHHQHGVDSNQPGFHGETGLALSLAIIKFEKPISYFFFGKALCVKDCCGDGLLGGNIPSVTCDNFEDVWQVWQGPLEGGSYVVVVVNRSVNI